MKEEKDGGKEKGEKKEEREKGRKEGSHAYWEAMREEKTEVMRGDVSQEAGPGYPTSAHEAQEWHSTTESLGRAKYGDPRALGCTQCLL